MSASPFDEFQRAPDPFDEFQRATPPVGAVLKTAVQTNPDDMAEAVRLAKRYPAPVDSLYRNLPKVRFAAVADDAADQLATAKALSQYLASRPHVAGMAHDDIPKLKEIESNFAQTAPAAAAQAVLGISEGIWRTPDAAQRAVGYLASTVEKTGLPPYLNPIRGVQDVLQFISEGRLPVGPKLMAGTTDVADRISGAQEILTDRATFGNAFADVQTLAKNADQALATAVQTGNLEQVGQVLTDPNYWSAFMAQAVPSLYLAMKSGGSVAFMGWLEGMEQASNAAEFEKRTGIKVTDQEFTQAFAQTAIVNALLERYGLDKVLGAKGNGLKGLAKAMAAEGGTEGLQQINSNLAALLAYNQEQGLTEGVLASVMGGVASGGGVSAAQQGAQQVQALMERQQQQARAAAEDAGRLQQLLGAAGQSLLRERSPEDFRAYVQTLGDKPLYVDGEVLNQLPAEVLNQLPESVREQIADAAATGDTVEIPMADVLTIAPGTPLEQVLNEHARMDPFASSKAEVAAAQDVLKQEAERVIQQAADAQVAQQEFDTVKAMYAEQIAATGRYRPAVAEQMGTWIASFYTAYGSRVGMTPTQFQQRYPVRVAGVPSSAGQVIDQPGSTKFDAWFGDSKVVDAEGKPLVVYHGTDSEFTAFDSELIGAGAWGNRAFGAESAAMAGAAFYLTSSKGHARTFGVNAMPLYAAIKNPLIVDAGAILDDYFQETRQSEDQGVDEWLDGFFGNTYQAADADSMFNNAIQEAKRGGHDGVIVDFGYWTETNKAGSPDIGKVVIAFRPEQIKSATGNNGNFDPQNPSILEQSGDLAGGELSPESRDLLGRLVAVARQALADSRNDQAVVAQPLENGAGLDAQNLTDLPEGDPGAMQESALGQDPALFAVLAEMRRAVLDDPKVLGAIVGTLPVDVVDNLVGEQGPAERLLRDQPMFQDGAAVNADLAVAQAVDATDPGGLLLREAARRAAELARVPLGAGRETGEGGAAAGAGQGDSLGQNRPSTRGPLATFNPRTLEIVLNPHANLSSFFHETGHFFLEVMADVASQPGAPAQIVEDMATFLKWAGITGDETVGGVDSGAPLAQMPTDSLRALAYNIPDAEIDAIFGVEGLVYYANLRPFENAQQTMLGQAVEPITSRAIRVQQPITAQKLAELELVPASQDARMALASEIGARGVFAALGKGGTIAIVTLSAKSPGQFQRTVFDRSGPVSDSQHPTIADAIVQSADAGFTRELDPVRAEKLIQNTLAQGGPQATSTQPLPKGRTPLEVWRSMTLDQQRPYHERWAESIEQYVMEGKAPSVELQPLMRRFSAWLKSVYGSIKQFLAQRGVPVGGGETLGQSGDQTETPEFKAWFGDSKVVDKTGKPRVMYHGTGSKEQIDVMRPPAAGGYRPSVMFFSPSKREAAGYASRIDKPNKTGLAVGEKGAHVLPVYLKMSNPLDSNNKAQRAKFLRERQDEDIYDYAKRMGHDGVITGLGEWVVFDSTQIKSAIGNDGTFDANDPSLLSQDPAAPAGPQMALNDDIRRVMDRMLATDEQIQQANEVAGLVPDEAADGVAEERLRKRSIADLKWAVKARDAVIAKLKKEARAIEKRIREEVTAEVNQMREVQAKDMLAKSQKENGGKLNDTERAIIADAFSYESVDAMLQAIDAFGGKADVIDGMTEQRMLEEHGDLIDERAMQAAANEAVHNEARARSLATELRTQAEMLGARAIKTTDLNENDAPVGAWVKLPYPDMRGQPVAQVREVNVNDLYLPELDENGQLQPEKRGYLPSYTDKVKAGEKPPNITVVEMEDGRLRVVDGHRRVMAARAAGVATIRATVSPLVDLPGEGKVPATAELLGRRQAPPGRRVTVNALVEAAKQFAANVVGKTSLRDLKAKAWQHTAAERRASKRWQEATAAGKTQDAVKAKQDQMLNHAAAKAAIDAQAEARKILDFFARVTKGNDETVVEKGRDADLVNAARAVLAAYGVQTPASKGAEAYLESLAKHDPETYNVVKPMVDAATQNAQPLEALTFDELQALHEEVQAMWFLAKRTRQMEVDGDLLDIDDVAQELYSRMEEIGIPDEVPGERGALTRGELLARQWLQQAPALLRRVEQWAEAKDGKFGGPFLRFIFQPVKDAADRYRTARLEYRKKFQSLVDNIAPMTTPGTIDAPELGYVFGRGHNGGGMAELLHAIAHTGNESNKRKLLLGRQWATELPDGTLDTSRWDAFIQRLTNEGRLQREHFDFVQGVWDLLEETKPLAQKTHREVFGRYFAEVTADAFVDPFGVQRRGGYIPAQADPLLVQDADLRELLETENVAMSQAFPQTNRGFTKSRVEYNRPLKLDLRTLPQHIDKVLLFAHMEPAVRGVARVLRRPKVSQPLARIDPAAMGAMLKPWLNRSARQTVETPISADAGLNRMASAVRGRVGMALMFANVSNTLQQITGSLTASIKVKPGLMMRATAQFIANPKKFKQSVWDISPYMADRAANEVAVLSDTLDKILVNPSVWQSAEHFTRRHAYFLQTAFDNQMSPIIWSAAYNQALADGVDERMAVRFADGVIRQTQGSTLPEDVSRIETGPAYARLFTQFVGYFNMMANTNATAIQQIAAGQGLRKGAGKAFYTLLLGLLAPIWVAEAIAHAMRGGPDDEDDDGWLDDWLVAVFGFGTIRGLLSGVPFLGAVGQSVVNRFNRQPADDKFSLSPTVSVLESAAGAPASVYKAIVDDKSKQKAVRDTAALITVLTGLPAMAVARPLGYAAGMADDRINPTGPADMARGLVTGTASPESRTP